MTLDIKRCLAEHRQAVDCVQSLESKITEAVALLRRTFDTGHRVFACGNGGSAADAQHFASELTGRYEHDRRPYPAMALTTDTSALTAIGNDYGFEHLFTRQLQALAQPGDVLIAISTSGKSPNIIHTVDYAHAHGIRTIGLLGRDGGQLAARVDLALVVNAQRTPRVQEAHILILHMLCEAFEA